MINKQQNERIICDNYQKGKKHIFGDDPNAPFNQKIVAVNNMYGWLYNEGILKEISFELKDYSDITYFAFDVADLKKYRKMMEESGVEGAELAVQHIFDEKYSPCHYSGAIELSWTMMSYRDFGGTVGRDWECELSRYLASCAVLDVAEIRKKDGVKAAVKAMFDLSGFDPSDL